MRIRRIMVGTSACLLAGALALPSHHHQAAPVKPAAAHVTVAHADWIRPSSINELKHDADAVITGTVMAIQPDKPLAAKGHPGTFVPTLRVKVDVTDVLTGKAPGTVTLHQIGGDGPDGNPFYLDGDPPYRIGQKIAAFLLPGTPGIYHTGPDGRFDISSDGEIHNPDKHGVGGRLNGLTVAQLKEKVR